MTRPIYVYRVVLEKGDIQSWVRVWIGHGWDALGSAVGGLCLDWLKLGQVWICHDRIQIDHGHIGFGF